jgi:signal transduction histidine kinase
MIALILAAVWTAPLHDSSEPSRWYRMDEATDPGLIAWYSEQENLVVEASAGLSTRSITSIYRLFPESFLIHSDDSLALSWRWKIADTRRSDAVAIGFVTRNSATGTLSRALVMASHTRFTLAWRVSYDEAERWYDHRITLGSSWVKTLFANGEQPVGVFLSFVNPVGQRARLARIGVETARSGRFETDARLLPHRLPVQIESFVPTTPHSLLEATTLAAEDLDQDGRVELLIGQHRQPLHLFRRTPGAVAFEDITQRAGLQEAGIVTGALFSDLDRDHDVDLVLTAEFDVPILYENIGGLRFERRSLADDNLLSFWYGCAAADADRDGDLDLACTTSVGAPGTVLLRQESIARWTAVIPDSWSPFDPRRRNGFATTWIDLAHDRFPDLVFGKTWISANHEGVFAAPQPIFVAPELFTEVEGQVVTDLDNDGTQDLIVVTDQSDEAAPALSFHRGVGDEALDPLPGPDFPEMTRAEVVLAEDFDNDGRVDLYVCRDHRPHRLMTHGDDGGWTESSEELGLASQAGCSAAIAADFDDNGALDLAVVAPGEPPRLALSTTSEGHWLRVRLLDASGSEAVGARLDLYDTTTQARLLTRWALRGRGFGSHGPIDLHLGLGPLQSVRLVAQFPSGRLRERTVSSVDRAITLVEPSGSRFSTTGAALNELRHDLVRQARRSWVASFPALFALFALGGGIGFLLVSVRRGRTVWLATALPLFVGTATLGSIPGRGFAGWPLGWALTGGVIGSLIPSAAHVAVRLSRRLARGRQTPAALRDLVQCATDFRHSGAESRRLVGMHSRLQNLFVEGRLHERFRRELIELASAYRASSTARVLHLAELAELALGDSESIEQLTRSAREVDRVLGSLPRLPHADLEVWQRGRGDLLVLLQSHRERLEALLLAIDRSASIKIAALHAAIEQILPARRGELEMTSWEPTPELGSTQLVIDASVVVDVLELLIDNAVQASPDRKVRAMLSWTTSSRSCSIAFEDDGPGVPAEIADRIFELGFSTRGSGRGYGLHRARELLAPYGARLELQAPVQLGGARFVLIVRVCPLTPTPV